MTQVTLYTDGSCEPNPGKGGWACILMFEDSLGIKHRKPLSGCIDSSTNNRMEIMAVLEGLRAIKRPCDVTIYSDSQYVVNGVGDWSGNRPAAKVGWMVGWEGLGWRRKDGQLLNPDLWQALWTEVIKHDSVTRKWVRGHNGDPINEECDRLALAAREQ